MAQLVRMELGPRASRPSACDLQSSAIRKVMGSPIKALGRWLPAQPTWGTGDAMVGMSSALASQTMAARMFTAAAHAGEVEA
jgi:hypothetical protein